MSEQGASPLSPPVAAQGMTTTMHDSIPDTLIISETQGWRKKKRKIRLLVRGLLLLLVLPVLVSCAGASAVPGELIIGYETGWIGGGKQAVASIDTITARIGATVIDQAGTADLDGIRVVSLPGNVSEESASQAFSAQPGVRFVEPNYIARLDSVTPNDPLFSSQWGISRVSAPAAWDITTGSSPVLVALIDTGADTTHSDLSGNVWTNTLEIAGNKIDDDGNGYIDDVHGWDCSTGGSDPSDNNGHGTLCAGIIAATGNNGVGISGVSWKASVIPVKVFGSDGTADTVTLLKGLAYAKKTGASVISCSWSMDEESQALKEAISGSSALFICSAGNDGTANPRYPAASDLSNIISVTAADQSDTIPYFASYGPGWVDLAAPGVSLTSLAAGGSYTTFSGSSAAVPVVSGTAVLMKSVSPGLSVAELKSAILRTVDTNPFLSGAVGTGGRLNTSQAVKSVAPASVPAPRALFSVNRSTGYAPLTISFTDKSWNKPEQWLWDFGDGTRSVERSPVHTYTGGGHYRPSLTVINAGGTSTIRRAPISVLSPNAPPPPRALFKLAIRRTGLPVTIRCLDLSSGDPDSWIWHFGDGSISTLREPSHVYSSAGVYYVRLTVSNAGGKSTVARRLQVS